MTTDSSIRLSLATTVFNRLTDLRTTLPHNLRVVRARPNVNIVVVDCGGQDSDEIAAWMEQEFGFDLLSGSLQYFRATTPWPSFDMARAKNAAHRLATGEFVLSIDADNFVDDEDLDLLLDQVRLNPHALFHQTSGPPPLRHRMWEQYGLLPSADDYHDLDLTWDGSCGRIAVSRAHFEDVNGYNENFAGMGMEDIDFLIRCIRSGASYTHRAITRPAHEVFLDNGTAAKEHQHSENIANWQLMDESLARGTFVASYANKPLSECFAEFVPRCVQASASARVTLFSSICRAERYIDRFTHDLSDIVDATTDAVVWLLDVVGSHPPSVSEALQRLAKRKGTFYLAVRRDPGLYALWNIALRSIRSRYVGNVNVDDLRGRGWLAECLNVLESGLADVASPVTVPFDDPGATSYMQALSSLRSNGSVETRWFEYRVVPNGAPTSPTIEHLPLEDGVYDHRDLFQILPDGQLASYCIPNACAIWRSSLHKRVGYFDEERYGCFADLALWVGAGADGGRFRQVRYPILFFIHEDQAHRRQIRDDRRLWSLALQNGTDQLRAWAGRRCYDLSRVRDSYGADHLMRWNRVCDLVSRHFVDTPGNLLLDLFVEQTFVRNERSAEEVFHYAHDWVGMVHSTPLDCGTFEMRDQDLGRLLEEPGFLKSLPRCRALVALSETSRAFVEEWFRSLKIEVPVFRLFDPIGPGDVDREFPDQLSVERFCRELERVGRLCYSQF